MTQAFADALSRLPLTRGFANTLARAHDYATQQTHREVTLEHLLLALAEDSEASIILQSSNVDLNRLLAEVSSLVGRNEDRVPPGQRPMPGVSQDLLRILEYSGAAARQSKRGREINGAIVLAAIVGDGKSTSAHILRAQGLTFEAAIKALQRPPALPQVAPEPLPQVSQSMPPLPPPLREVSARHQQVPSPPVPVAVMPPQMPIAGPHYVAENPAHASYDMPLAAAAVAYEPAAPQETTEDILASVRRRIDAGRGQGARAAQMQDPGTREPELPPLPSDPAAELDVPVDAWIPEPDEPLPRATQPVIAQSPRAMRSPPPLPAPPEPRPIAAAVAQSLADARNKLHLDGEPDAEAEPAANRPAFPQGRGGALHPIAPWPEVVSMAPPAAVEVSGAAGEDAVPQQQGSWVEPTGRIAVSAQPEPTASRRYNNSGESGQAAAWPAVGIDALREFIPRSMCVRRVSRVEAGIAKSDLRLLARALDGTGLAHGQDVIVGKALTVRLRAPDGGAWVEPQSPETIWVDSVRALARDDLGSWGWNVTPQRRGTLDLVLSVSARTIGADGTAAETAFPDRALETRVGIDRAALALRLVGGLGLILAGALAVRFAGPLSGVVVALLGR